MGLINKFKRKQIDGHHNASHRDASHRDSEAVSEQQQLNEEKRDMIRGIEELAETSVKEVMIPRIDVDFLSCGTPQDELLEKIAESGHSRFPVYSESIDNVIGVLYVKFRKEGFMIIPPMESWASTIWATQATSAMTKKNTPISTSLM